jgi:hypothetical protein
MSSPCYLRESFQPFTKSTEERGCVDEVSKALGLPLGSRMVESACKWLIQ